MADSIKYPIAVDCFETSDGALHRSIGTALRHQQRIDSTAECNRLLREGMSIGNAMRTTGLLPVGCYPEIDDLTCADPLVISHWQCRDQPGYKVVEVRDEGGIFVHGDAGSWSGPYGAVVDVIDLVRYWEDTKRRRPGAAPR